MENLKKEKIDLENECWELFNSIYIVKVYYQNLKEWGISSECYITKENAIEFIENKLTKTEIENNKKLKKRGLIAWYEFVAKNEIYEIKVLDLKG